MGYKIKNARGVRVGDLKNLSGTSEFKKFHRDVCTATTEPMDARDNAVNTARSGGLFNVGQWWEWARGRTTKEQNRASITDTRICLENAISAGKTSGTVDYLMPLWGAGALFLLYLLISDCYDNKKKSWCCCK